MPDWLAAALITLLKAVLVILGLLTGFAYMTLVERKLLGRFQLRPGPNRVGPFALLQPLADAIKSIFKEDLQVTMADKLVYTIAPIISVTFALVAFGGIPAGPAGSLFGENPWVYNLDAGILVLLAMTSMGVYGIFLGGWASGSKYPLLGGLRSSAQMISYELGMGLSLLGVLMMVGSTRMTDIVQYQAVNGWFIFFQAFAFILFLISAFAETNRAPFDLPECESELVGGYGTDYSGFRFAMFYLGEYMNMGTLSAICATLFLGGFHAPWPLNGTALDGGWWGIMWFIIKVAIMLFFFLKDGPKFLPWLKGYVGVRAGWHLTEVCMRSWNTLSGFIRTQAIVSMVDAVFIGLGLLFLGLTLWRFSITERAPSRRRLRRSAVPWPRAPGPPRPTGPAPTMTTRASSRPPACSSA